jgi:hypothetical protein
MTSKERDLTEYLGKDRDELRGIIGERDAEVDRLNRELDARPAYLDGLSIDQWRAHAKAGWAMYAARTTPEPLSGHADIMAVLDLVEGKCPICEGTDLHSATINGSEGVNCCECDWGSTYKGLRERALRASQPPSLLREVAAIAYDTSKAAEDRIRDIQDLWEGATAPPDQARNHLRTLVDAVAHMRVPQTMADAALQVSVTLGPALRAAQEYLSATPTKSCEACRATTVDDCYFSEDPPANCAHRPAAGE